MYKVKEIFRSIQGEGFHSGKNAVFIRFSGCNLWNGIEKFRKKAICNFCDTDFVGVDGENGGEYKLDDLIKKTLEIWGRTKSHHKKFVVLTGGEPLLQVDKQLIRELKKKNFYIAVETNGTIRTKLKFDWIVVSPKQNATWNLKNGDELKVVYPQNKINLKKALNLKFKYFFLQPMANEFKQLNIIKTIDYCKSHKPWFPSFQIHKSLGIS
ncbi:MAG: 7-carboxy-7-deazaguanine synthase [Alphaproteobacteria bacterium]|nr:7-carboxy-7-deazaguanine synthase [Alphaproteobacteria bacterium]